MRKTRSISLPGSTIEPMTRASRQSYTRWVAMEPIDQLAAQLGSTIWIEQFGGQQYRLEPRDKAILKAEVVSRVKAAGGRIEAAGLVLTTEGDGLKVAVGLPRPAAARG